MPPLFVFMHLIVYNLHVFPNLCLFVNLPVCSFTMIYMENFVYRYPLFIKVFYWLYIGNLAHIFILLSFFTERSNQFKFFTRLLHLWWSYSHMVIWPNGHNMTLRPYWGHTRMIKRRTKLGVYWKPIINVAT